MPYFDLAIKNANIVTAEKTFRGSVGIRNGKIEAIYNGMMDVEAERTIDAKEDYLLPGGVDPHVHIRYPGGAHRENFYTGSAAAVSGGTTTIIEHPISEPPQYSPEILQKRVKLMKEQSVADVAFLGAAGGDFLEEIERIGKAGIVGYKTFLHEPPEGREKEFMGLCSQNNYELFEVLKRVKKTGLLMAAHTEDNELIQGMIARLRREGNTFSIAHCLSRPPIAEVLAVQKLLAMAKVVGARVYLVHISTPEAVEIAKRARQEGQEVYIETCPHYLYFDEKYVEHFGAFAKCNPALRSKEYVEKMWKYVEDGTIDTIGSDHAPYTFEEKTRNPEDIFKAPAGFPGIEVRLAFMMKAVREGRISINRAVGLLSTNPARIFQLSPQKGEIAIGSDADLVLLDPFEEYELDFKKMLTHARDICAFMNNIKVAGKIKYTVLRGRIVYENGKVIAEKGFGEWVQLKK